MNKTEEQSLEKTIKELFTIVDGLEDAYREYGRKFTVDGHLLGSIGEVWAAEHYGIKLAINSNELHDGVSPDGKKVQIKITQTSKVSFYGVPDYLLVFKVEPGGEITEIYNGPSGEIFKDRKTAKNGQMSVSLNYLKKRMENVEEADKIHRID